MKKYRQLTRTKEINGKTIENTQFIDLHSRLVHFFSDGTFAVFEIERGYEPMDDEIVLMDDPLTAYQRFQLKIISKAEYDEIVRKNAKSREEDIRTKEIAELKRLQEKYNDGGD